MFTTQDILSKYNNLTIMSNGKNYSFPAFLEDSDITYDIKEQSLPFAPVSFTNDSMALRVLEKAKFTFNVFSHNEEECKANWSKFYDLRQIIKPRYTMLNEQLVPNIENITGFIKIKFSGMPHDRDIIDIHLTNFSYIINKELGYLEVDNKLIPIGFKISIEGKVLLKLEETISYKTVSIDSSGGGGSTAGGGSGNGGGSTSTNNSNSPASPPPSTSPNNRPRPRPSSQRMSIDPNSSKVRDLNTQIKVYEDQLANNGFGYQNSAGKFSVNFSKVQEDEDAQQLYQQYTNAVTQRNSLTKK